MVNIEKPGYEDVKIEIHSVLSGVVAGNIIAGGLIGWGVDAATGGQYRLVPEKIDVILKPINKEQNISTNKEQDISTIMANLEKLDKLRQSKAITDEEYNKLKEELIGQLKQIKNPTNTNNNTDTTNATNLVNDNTKNSNK